nr:DUF6292 family protein [Amycolatopsis orientalis]
MIPLLTGIDSEYETLHVLSDYLAAVGAALGVGEESCTVDLDTPLSAYVAMEGRLARHPDRDTALVWDERHGWSFAMETHSGEDLLVLAYLGCELVPAPARIAAFVARIHALGGPVPVSTPPDLHSDRDSLLGRVSRYRRDRWGRATAQLSHAGRQVESDQNDLFRTTA